MFDLIVIGAGSGGVRAARMAASKGAKVALIEAARLGGTCVNLGCIPKKLYSYASHYAQSFEESKGYGWVWDQAPRFDWDVLKKQRATEIERLNGVYEKMLINAGVTILRGYGQLAGNGVVNIFPVDASAEYATQAFLRGVQGEEARAADQGQIPLISADELKGQIYLASAMRIKGAQVLIASGSTAYRPDVPGRDLMITSNEVFDLPTLPKTLLVQGSGYIACEMASIFAGLGCTVYQVVRGDAVLRAFDQDVSEFITAQMKTHGVQILENSDVLGVERLSDGRLSVQLKGHAPVVCDQVLTAIGREPMLAGLGFVEQGGALTDKGHIQADTQFATNLPGVSALGDVIGTPQLTPVALAQAMVYVDNHWGAKAGRSMDYQNIPTAVFTHPNIGTVGLSEHQADAQFGAADVEVYKSEFRALKHTLSGVPERALMKLIVQKSTRKVLGLHMVGADAGEVVQGFAVAVKAGLTKEDFDATIGIHPTGAEEFVTMRTPVSR